MKNFKKNIGKFFRRKREIFEPKEINSHRDWRIIVAIFIFLNIVAVSFGVYEYREINRGDFFNNPNKEEIIIESIDRSELAKAIEFYEAKKRVFQEVKSQKPEIVDPSL